MVNFQLPLDKDMVKVYNEPVSYSFSLGIFTNMIGMEK